MYGVRLSCLPGGMQATATLFAQITSGLFAAEFSRLVQKYPARKPSRGITAYDQFSGLAVPWLVFALDSTLISLALNLCPWAYYPRTKQGAVKLHVLLSLQGNLPAWP